VFFAWTSRVALHWWILATLVGCTNVRSSIFELSTASAAHTHYCSLPAAASSLQCLGQAQPVRDFQMVCTHAATALFMCMLFISLALKGQKIGFDKVVTMIDDMAVTSKNMQFMAPERSAVQ